MCHHWFTRGKHIYSHGAIRLPAPLPKPPASTTDCIWLNHQIVDFCLTNLHVQTAVNKMCCILYYKNIRLTFYSNTNICTYLIHHTFHIIHSIHCFCVFVLLHVFILLLLALSRGSPCSTPMHLLLICCSHRLLISQAVTHGVCSTVYWLQPFLQTFWHLGFHLASTSHASSHHCEWACFFGPGAFLMWNPAMNSGHLFPCYHVPRASPTELSYVCSASRNIEAIDFFCSKNSLRTFTAERE